MLIVINNTVSTIAWGATSLTGDDSILQGAIDSDYINVVFDREYQLTTSKLDVGSNKVLTSTGEPITQTLTGDAKVFNILPSSVNVSISKFDLRGPYYGIATLYSAENTGINAESTKMAVIDMVLIFMIIPL